VEQEIIKVAIYGATGYTGVELLRLLQNHPKVKVTALISQSYAGKRLSEVLPFFYGELGNLTLSYLRAFGNLPTSKGGYKDRKNGHHFPFGCVWCGKKTHTAFSFS